MLLYKYDYKKHKTCLVQYNVQVKNISPFHLFITGEKVTLKTLILRLYFAFISKNNFKITFHQPCHEKHSENIINIIKNIENSNMCAPLTAFLSFSQVRYAHLCHDPL